MRYYCYDRADYENDCVVEADSEEEAVEAAAEWLDVDEEDVLVNVEGDPS